jgi:hypothetical protein
VSAQEVGPLPRCAEMLGFALTALSPSASVWHRTSFSYDAFSRCACCAVRAASGVLVPLVLLLCDNFQLSPSRVERRAWERVCVSRF